MKHKVTELKGALLDAAVAKAEGIEHDTSGLPRAVFIHQGSDSTIYSPSTNWAFGGPLIERERITLLDPSFGRSKSKPWEAFIQPTLGMDYDIHGKHSGVGPTPLIAAMRAFISLKFGATVDLP